MAEPEVVLSGIFKGFGREEAKDGSWILRDVSLTIARGELVVLVGPSGCGKSTTLRMIAGLDDPDRGTIQIGGRSMDKVAPQNRDVAMVFQGYALYPQMTVRQILEFPLRMRNVPLEERNRAVQEAAALLRIEALLGRRPGELSGGERQRVAMGRAIVRKPKVFLFDEPLSNLDAALRADLRIEIGALVRRLGATAIYVTHDHVEAMTLADRIAVMSKGEVRQFAPPRDVYEKPADTFVATFIGSPRMNLFPAKFAAGVLHADPFRWRLDRAVPESAKVGVRPEDVQITRDGVPAEVVALEPLGAETHLILKAGELSLQSRVSGFFGHPRGSKVNVTIDPTKLHVFAASGGARVHNERPS